MNSEDTDFVIIDYQYESLILVMLKIDLHRNWIYVYKIYNSGHKYLSKV